MTLVELQKILGERIDVTLSDISGEERQIENEKSGLILGIAKQMINNADIILRTEKLMVTTGNKKKSIAMDLIVGDRK